MFTVAIQALKTAANLPASALLRAAAGVHAAALHLEASCSVDGVLRVKLAAAADPRAIAAARNASANAAAAAVANGTYVPPAGSRLRQLGRTLFAFLHAYRHSL